MLGDETKAIDFNHGNTKEGTCKPFVRTCPSTLKKLKSDCSVNTAGTVYKREVSTMRDPPELVPIKTPRNLKQLRNMRYKCLQQSRISQDTLYNLHEVAYDVSGYMWKIITYPDLTCVFGMQEVLEELDKVLLLDCDNQILSYDTTFQLGDFYVSPFIFRHTLFAENPCIPVMFLLHERKLTTTHQELFTELRTRVPSLQKCKYPVVTDREQAIENAISVAFPNIPLMHCWNHIFRDIRFWLRAHHAPSSDVSVYVNDASRLFHQPTPEGYSDLLQDLRHTWDARYEKYFMTSIHPQVSNS